MKDLMGSPILKGIDTTTTTPQFNMPPVTRAVFMVNLIEVSEIH